MKSIKKINLGIVIIVFLYFLNVLIRDWKNINNLKTIEIGMCEENVINRMKRKPYKIELPTSIDSVYVFLYTSPFGSSDDIRITFSKKDSLVIDVYNGG